MSLDTIIQVSIDRQTKIPSQLGFGIALIMGKSNKLTSEVQTFNSLEDVGGVFDVTDEEYKAASKLLGQTVRPTTLKIAKWANADSAAVALNKVLQYDSDWYALIMCSHLAADIELVAPIIEAQVKVFATSSSDVAIFDGTSTTDVAYVLKHANYARTFLLAKKSGVTDYPEAAWIGGQLPFIPGSTTFKFKTLHGVADDAGLNPTEKAAAAAKNANTYLPTAGIDITEEGVMADGEFIDIIMGVDWIQVNIQQDIFFQMVNLPKIPYTNAGVNVIVSQIRAVLQAAINNNILRADPKPTTFAPDVQDVSPIDRGNRLLPGVTFQAQLAGAIHKVSVLGTVTV